MQAITGVSDFVELSKIFAVRLWRLLSIELELKVCSVVLSVCNRIWILIPEGRILSALESIDSIFPWLLLQKKAIAGTAN